MALVSYSATPSKGATVTATLDKTELLSIDAVTADAWWAQESSIATAVLTFESEPGKGKIVLQFDFTQDPCTAQISFPAYTRDVFQITKIVLIDTMGDKLTLNRATLLAQAPTFSESEIELNGGGPPPVSTDLLAIQDFDSFGYYLGTKFFVNDVLAPQFTTIYNVKDIANDGNYFWYVTANNRLNGSTLIDGATSLEAVDVLSDSRVVLGGYSDDLASGAVFVQGLYDPNLGYAPYNSHAIYSASGTSNVRSISVAKSINDVYVGSIILDQINDSLSAELSVYQDSTGMVQTSLTAAYGGSIYQGGNQGIDIGSAAIKVIAKEDSSAVVMLSSYTERAFGQIFDHFNFASVAKSASSWSPQVFSLSPPQSGPTRVFPSSAYPILDNSCLKDAAWDGGVVYVCGFLVGLTEDEINGITTELKPGYWTANINDPYPGSEFIELDVSGLGYAGYTEGVAESVTVTDNVVRIAGWIKNPNTGETKAVVWEASPGNPTTISDKSALSGLNASARNMAKFIGKA